MNNYYFEDIYTKLCVVLLGYLPVEQVDILDILDIYLLSRYYLYKCYLPIQKSNHLLKTRNIRFSTHMQNDACGNWSHEDNDDLMKRHVSNQLDYHAWNLETLLYLNQNLKPATRLTN